MPSSRFARLFATTILTATSLFATQAQALSWSKDTHKVHAGDFDGDNIDELLLVAKHNLGTHAIIKSNAGDYNLVLKQWTNGDANGLWLNWSESRIQIGDVDGDNIDDIFLQDSNQTNIIKNTSSGILSHITQTLVTSFGISWAKANYKIHVGDFNGDGQSDLLAQPNTPNSHTLTIHADSAGQYSSVDLLFTGETQGVDWSQYYSHITIVDLDADGKDDVLLTAEPHLLPLTLGDEGEEMAFHVPIMRDPHNVVFRADPNGIFTQGISGWSWDVDYLDTRWDTASVKIHAGDFDNDGYKDDLLLQSRDGTSYFVYGNGGIPASKTVASHAGVNFESSELTILDSDGDGVSDIYFNTAGTPVLLQHVSGTSYTTVNQSSEAVGVRAVVTVNKTSGTTADTFIFNAKDSELAEEYCYDWDNDGDCETPWSADPVATRVFLSEGTHTVRLKARNAGGDADSVTLGVSVAAYALPDTEYTHTAPTITTAAVGTIDGSFSVTPQGAATYSLPIAVPPGRNNMQPSISIGYNSQSSASGHLGAGWSVSGMSEISRCRKSKAHGETEFSIQWNNSDQFCLDGQRLIEVSQRYVSGQKRTEYRTMHESYSKITGFAINSGNPKGPFKFEVRTKDGKIHTYGNDATSHKAYRRMSSGVYAVWAISTTKDTTVDKNTINYYYENTEDNLRIIQIGYSPNLGVDTRRVDFVYEDEERPDIKLHYHNGLKTRVTKRLGYIQTFVKISSQWKPVYKYGFEYSNASNYFGVDVDKSKLVGITQCAFDDTSPVCLTPVSFEYAAAHQQFTNKDDVDFEMSDTEQLRHYMLDINGDAIQDFVYFEVEEPEDCAQIGTQGNCAYYHPENSWVVHFGQRGEVGITKEPYFMIDAEEMGVSVTDARRAIPIDNLNDGRQDLMVPTSNGWRVISYVNDSSDFSNCLTDECFKSINIGFDDDEGDGNRPVPLDINGDGFSDLIWYAGGSVKYRLSVNGDFSQSVDQTIVGVTRSFIDYAPLDSGEEDTITEGMDSVIDLIWDNFVYIDYDADGDIDILYQHVRSREFFGDYCLPRTHILEWNQQSEIFVNKELTGLESNVFIGVEDQCFSSSKSIDINGDGISDIAYQNNADKKWYANINKGDGSFDNRFELGISSTAFPGSQTQLVDINADGLLDFMALKNGKIRFAVNLQSELGFKDINADLIYFTSRSSAFAKEENVFADSGLDIVADFDGDGFDDVLYLDGDVNFRRGSSTGFNGQELNIGDFFVQGTSTQKFNTLVQDTASLYGQETTNLAAAVRQFWSDARIVDIDSDGDLDIAYIVPNVTKKARMQPGPTPVVVGYEYVSYCGNDLRALVWNGTTFVDQDVTGEWSGRCPDNFTFGDLSGDGKHEMIAAFEPGFEDLGSGNILTWGHNNWQIFENTGGDFAAPVDSQIEVDFSRPERIEIIDYNNDGLFDVVVDENKWVTAYLNQSSYEFSRVEVELSTFGEVNAALVKTADINGDGMADLIRGKGKKLNYAFNKSKVPYLMEKINHGYGVVTEIDYESLSNAQVHDEVDAYKDGSPSPECGTRSICVTPPMLVVSEHRATSGFSSSGEPILYGYQYKYGDYRVDKFGHGALGFGVFTTIDNNSHGAGLDQAISSPATRSVVSVVEFDNSDKHYNSTLNVYPYLGSPTLAQRYVNGSLISEKISTYEHQSTVVNGELPFLSRAKSAIDITYTIGLEPNVELSRTVIEYTDFDYEYGNALVVEAVSADGTSTKTTSTYWESYSDVINNVAVDPHWRNNWFIGRLRSAEVETTSLPGIYNISTSDYGLPMSNQSTPIKQVRKSAFTYNKTTGLLVQEIVEPTDELIGVEQVESSQLTSTDTVLTTYTHDNYGHVITKTIAGKLLLGGVMTRSSSSEYALDFYDAVYPEIVSNELGHTQTFETYDPKFGLSNIVSGPNGIKSYKYYDAFGREVRTQSEIGNYIDTSYSHYVSGSISGKIIEKHDSENGHSQVYFDALDREIINRATRFSAVDAQKYTVVKTEYDKLGRAYRASLPYDSIKTNYADLALEAPANWVYTYYDDFERQSRVVRPSVSGQAAISRMTYDYDEVGSRKLVKITTIDPLSDSKTEYFNTEEKLLRLDDQSGNSTYYDYSTNGQLAWVKDPLGLVTHIEYDNRGNKSKLYDPNMGTWVYSYNSLGELESQTDANGNTTNMAYDVLGRMETRTDGDGSYTKWKYDEEAKGIGKVSTIESYNANSELLYKESYKYDGLGRPWFVVQEIEGQSYASSTSYDHAGRPLIVKLPESLAGTIELKNTYDTNGFLSSIENNITSETYYSVGAVNIFGEVSEATVGAHGIKIARLFDSNTGLLTNIESDLAISTGGAFQNLSYQYYLDGNVKERRETVGDKHRKETFFYDTRDRLTTATLDNTVEDITSVTSYTYDDVGNIKTKSDFMGGATYSYFRHRISRIGSGPLFTYDLNGSVTYDGSRTISYNAFNKPSAMSDSDSELTFTYDANRSRLTKVVEGGAKTTYVGGGLEKIQIEGKSTFKYLISSGVASILETRVVENGIVKENDNKTAYMLKDHIGSTDVILEYGVTTDTANPGAFIREVKQSFGSFGKRRRADWASVSSIAFLELPVLNSITTKGYTGHEMDDEVGLINMGGRIYSPEIGRFTSADPHIQDPGNPQNLSRYSYVWNNPLSNTDPSGYLTKPRGTSTALIKLAYGPTATKGNYQYHAVGLQIVGSAFAGVTYGLSAGAAAFVNGYVATNGDLEKSFVAGVKAAVLAYVFVQAFDAAGTALGDVTWAGSSGSEIAVAMSVHGVLGGFQSVANGGKFGHGFVAGAVSKGASIVGVYTNVSDGNLVANATIAAVIGGTVSHATGGSFANGAVTGAFSRLFNDLGDHFGSEDKIAGPPTQAAKAYDDLKYRWKAHVKNNPGDPIVLTTDDLNIIVARMNEVISSMPVVPMFKSWLDVPILKVNLQFDSLMRAADTFLYKDFHNVQFSWKGELYRAGEVNYIGIGMMAAHQNREFFTGDMVIWWNAKQYFGEAPGSGWHDISSIPANYDWALYGVSRYGE